MLLANTGVAAHQTAPALASQRPTGRKGQQTTSSRVISARASPPATNEPESSSLWLDDLEFIHKKPAWGTEPANFPDRYQTSTKVAQAIHRRLLNSVSPEMRQHLKIHFGPAEFKMAAGDLLDMRIRGINGEIYGLAPSHQRIVADWLMSIDGLEAIARASSSKDPKLQAWAKIMVDRSVSLLSEYKWPQ